MRVSDLEFNIPLSDTAGVLVAIEQAAASLKCGRNRLSPGDLDELVHAVADAEDCLRFDGLPIEGAIVAYVPAVVDDRDNSIEMQITLGPNPRLVGILSLGQWRMTNGYVWETVEVFPYGRVVHQIYTPSEVVDEHIARGGQPRRYTPLGDRLWGQPAFVIPPAPAISAAL